VRAVLFDLDDTLITTRAAMEASAPVALSAIRPELTDGAALEGGRLFRADAEGWFAAFTRGEVDFWTMRRRRVAATLQSLGIASRDGDAEAFEAAYGPAFSDRIAAFDDVSPLLRRCLENRWQVGVFTNSGEVYTEGKLAWSGLTGRVGPVITRDTLGRPKPEPEGFLHLCELVGVAPEEAVFVGDELETDIEGAVGAGLRAVWLRREGYERDPELVAEAERAGIPVISSLAECPELLTRE